jgi:hypothetical protein
VSGTAVAGPETTFGFRSGFPSGTGDFDFGVVDFDNSVGSGFTFVGERTVVSLGTTYSGNTVDRAYSISFSTGAREPSSLLLFAMPAVIFI